MLQTKQRGEANASSAWSAAPGTPESLKGAAATSPGTHSG